MDWLNQNQGSLEVLLTSMFVLFNTIVLVLNARSLRTTEASLEAMKRRHAESMAPELGLDIELDWSRGFAYLVLQNTGRTAARDVRVEVAESLLLSLELDFKKIACFHHALSLAPGQKERYFLGLIGPILGERISRRERGRTSVEMPFEEACAHNKKIPALTGRIRYSDRTGAGNSTPVEINLEALRKSRQVVTEGFGALIEEMAQLARTVESIGRGHVKARR